jgi:hypothetical protein
LGRADALIIKGNIPIPTEGFALFFLFGSEEACPKGKRKHGKNNEHEYAHYPHEPLLG